MIVSLADLQGVYFRQAMLETCSHAWCVILFHVSFCVICNLRI